MRFGRFILSLLLLVAIVAALIWLWPHQPLSTGARADRILVEKSKRRLTLLKDGKVLKSYRVSLGRNPEGPKTKRGDSRTPEGLYRIDWRNQNSKFHRALHISYPNQADWRRARKTGVSPGSAIMVHGMKNGFGWIGHLHLAVDWTNGCIAVTDEEIREIWRATPNGTPIEIRR